MQTKTRTSRTLLTATATLLFIGALSPTAHAATNSWVGGAGDGNWGSSANWDTALVASNSLIFSGNTQTATTNNISTNYLVGTNIGNSAAITFGNNGTNATSGFTLAGSSIAVGGDIVTAASSSNSPITDTIALNLQWTGSRNVTAGTNHNVIISGAISQSSGTRTFTKAGTGEVILQNAGNSYLGQTIINSGTLTINVAGGIANGGTNSALGAGATINSNSVIRFGGGTLNVTLGAGGTDRQVQIGSATATSDAGATINNNSANGSTPLVFSNAAFNASPGSITTNRVLTLGGTNTDANAISGVISDNNTAGGGLVGVTKVGSGLWVLSGSNSYSGSTTVGGTAGSSNGVLRIASVSSLPPNTTIVGSAGNENVSTLELAPGSYSVKNYLRGNINFAASSGQATLEFTNTAVTNVLTQGSGNKTIYSSNVAVRFVGSLDISAVADVGANKTATFSGNSGFTFDGPIIGPVVTNTNGSFTPGFVMNSTGVAVLNASNTYAGATDVKQGTLQVNGSISTNTLNISNGATLAGLGTVGGDVFVSGNLQPGRGATNGALTIGGNLSVASNGIVNLSIDSLAEYDRLAGAGSYNVGGTINVAASTNYSPADGNIFQLFSGAIGGTPTLNVTPLSNPNYVWVTNDFISTGQISVASTAPVLTPYGSWLTNYPGITNFPGGTSNTNGTADPDGDGFNNNMEFAFDGNPTVGTPALISAASSGASTLVSFLASTNTNAVSYMVQSTTNLATGPWADNSVVTDSITNSANQTNPAILLAPSYVRRGFTVTPAGSNSFYRVKATIAP